MTDGFYLVNLQTHVFGGGDRWKPVKKTKREVLAENTSNPDWFLENKEYVGKVMSVDATKYLLDYVAYVDTRDENVLKIGHGEGHMLGGLDSEQLYYEITEEEYNEKIKLYEEYETVSRLKPSDPDALKYADEADQPILKRFAEADKIHIPEKVCFGIMSSDNVMAVWKDIPESKAYLEKLDTFKTIADSNNEFYYVDEDTFKKDLKDLKVVESELLDKCTLKKIVSVHAKGCSPRIIFFKNGASIAMAPSMRYDDSDNYYQIKELRALYNKLKEKVVSLQKQIAGDRYQGYK